MKILYAIQGTGNGHISRARDIIPILRKKAEVDILVSGIQADVELGFDIKYAFKGLSFIFGKKGGIDILATYKKAKLKRLWKEIHSLPVEEYDIVISDFEPVSAWACVLKKKQCIGLSHQAAMLNKKTPVPKKTDPVGYTLLRHYAPTSVQYSFHFKKYDTNIFTPVIRKEIRDLKLSNKGHYTVYLPAYSDQRIISILSQFTKVKWQVFSKHTDKSYQEKNIHIYPVENKTFLSSIAGAEGVLCGAGFETPAEVMYMKKKLMVIPMKGQYEQQCNAAALKLMEVPVIKSLKRKHIAKISAWLQSDKIVQVDYPDMTEGIIDLVIQNAIAAYRAKIPVQKEIKSPKKIRSFLLDSLLKKMA